MPPNQIPPNLLALALSQMGQNSQSGGVNRPNPQGLSLPQMNQGDISPFGDTQVNPQQLRGIQPPAPASYSYQPQQSQMSQMQLTPTQQTMAMPEQQQQSNPLGDSMKGLAQSLNKVNQQNKLDSYDPYQGWGQDGQSDYYGPGIFGY